MNHPLDTFFWRKLALQLLILSSLVLGIMLWRSRPDQAMSWLAGTLFLPICWGLISTLGLLGKDQPDARRRRLYNALLGAGLLLVGALISATATTLAWLPDGWSTRYGMLTSALILIVIGNGLPKKVEPGCSRSHGQALQRLFGWTFVIGGLLLAVLWLSPLSVAIARPLSMLLYGLMLACCVAGYLRIRAREKQH